MSASSGATSSIASRCRWTVTSSPRAIGPVSAPDPCSAQLAAVRSTNGASSSPAVLDPGRGEQVLGAGLERDQEVGGDGGGGVVGGARVLGHLEGGHLADLGELPGQGERGRRPTRRSRRARRSGPPRDREPSAADGGRTSRSRARRPAPAPRGGSRRWCGRGSEARGATAVTCSQAAAISASGTQSSTTSASAQAASTSSRPASATSPAPAPRARQSALPTRPGPTTVVGGGGEVSVRESCIRSSSRRDTRRFGVARGRGSYGPLPDPGSRPIACRDDTCGPGPSPLRTTIGRMPIYEFQCRRMRRALRGADRRPAPARPGVRPAEPRTPSAGSRPSASATAMTPGQQRRMEDRRGIDRDGARQRFKRNLDKQRGAPGQAGIVTETPDSRREQLVDGLPRGLDMHPLPAWPRPGTRSSSGPATPTPT